MKTFTQFQLKSQRIFLLLTATLLFTSQLKSQLAGTYTVPGSFSTISNAVQNLNIYGVSAPVTIYVTSNHIETMPAGGIKMNVIAGSSTVNTITFQKLGSGANPIVQSNTLGIGTPSSSVQDGIWMFAGTDNVTIDGIDLTDINTTNPATMEYGFGFYKNNSGSNDGCQNNTIKNCVITLNRINNITATGAASDGSRGIEFVNNSRTNNTVSVTPQDLNGIHANNKIYNNYITNCNTGIVLTGYNSATNTTLMDQNNDIGGMSAVTGNTIVNYGGGGTLSPADAIKTLGQNNLNIGYNLINNNNGAGVYHMSTLRGIYLNSAFNANATVQGNTLTVSSTATNIAVWAIHNLSGDGGVTNTVNIVNNLLTACNLTLSGSTASYAPIWNGGSPANLNISGNTFTNNTIGATNHTIQLINNYGAVSGLISVDNNTLTQSINNSSLAFNGVLRGINSSSTTSSTTLQVNGNHFTAFDLPSLTGSCNINFIRSATSISLASVMSHSNTWGTFTLNTHGTIELIYFWSAIDVISVCSNSVTGTILQTGQGTRFRGIAIQQVPPSAVQTVSLNSISNFTNTTTGSGAFNGIAVGDNGISIWHPRTYILNNVISNILFNNVSSQTSYGIYFPDPGDGNTPYGSIVQGNRISNISCGDQFIGIDIESGSGANATPVAPLTVAQNTINDISTTVGNAYAIGMNISTYFRNVPAKIYKNKITNVVANGSIAVSSGVELSLPSASEFYNNLVGSISVPYSTHPTGAAGIRNNGQGNLYNNSVYMDAVSSVQMWSAAYSTGGTTSIRNNIFVNMSVANGTAVASAWRAGSISYMNTLDTLSDNNLFYAGTPNANHQIFYYSSGSYQTLAQLKTFRDGRDANSVTELPPFISTSPSSTNYLSISPSVSTQVESGGVPITGLSDDIIGTSRNSLPDIGAWEGNYLASTDAVGPVANALLFTSPACNLTGRTLTVSLQDVSGVSSGSLAPKIYYKLNYGGSYASVQGSLSAGTASAGVWDFNLTYSALVNDTVYYYLVSQDQSAAGNTKSLPIAGFNATDFNNVLQHPTSPYKYVVGMTLNGIYNVGAGGTFTSLTQSARAYNVGCLTGPVTYSLTNAYYGLTAGESFPIVFKDHADASATNSLLIKPASNLSVTVECTYAFSDAIFKLASARHITIDGLNSGGSSMKLIMPNQNQDFANVWLSSGVNGGVGCNSIGIHNLIFSKNGTQSSGFRVGILADVDDLEPLKYGGSRHNNISITGNEFTKLTDAIYALALSSASLAGYNTWAVTNNTVGSSSTVTNAVSGFGLLMNCAENLTVTGNLFTNMGIGKSQAAISLSTSVNNFSVTSNTLSNITGGSGTINSHLAGIFIGAACSNGTISYNNISNMATNPSGSMVCSGISICTGISSSSITVYNNFVGGVGPSTGSSHLGGRGIYIGSSGGCDIHHNSVNLFSQLGSAFYIDGTSNNVILRNNILANTAVPSSSVPLTNALYCSTPNNPFSIIDHNNYYAEGIKPRLAVFNGTQYNLAMLKSAFGQNNNSVNFLPVFTSSVDLHLDGTAPLNASFDNLAAPIGLTNDIDLSARNLSTPDMGAHEFNATTSCSLVSPALIADSSFVICSTQTLALNASNLSGGIGMQYTWQVSSNSSGPYSNVSGGTGSLSPTYLLSGVGSGTLYYVLSTTCPASSLTAISNKAKVVVRASPNPVIAANPTVICSGGSTTLTSTGGIGTHNWNVGGSASTLAITPTISTSYFLKVTNSPCPTVNSNTVTIFYALNPTITISPASQTLCPGAPATLMAMGADTYSWTNGALTQTIHPTLFSNATYTVTGFKNSGCKNTATTSLTVIPGPTLSIAGTSIICSGSSTSFSATGANTYSWTSGSNSSVAIVSPTINTTYTVLGFNASGCPGVATVAVVSNSVPLINIQASETTVCATAAVTFTAAGANSYTWNGSNTGATYSANPSAQTIYSVSGTNLLNCTSNQTILINTYSLPQLTVTPSSPSVCAGTSLSLLATGANSYTWNSSLSNSTFSLVATSSAIYTVVGAETINGCSNTKTIAVIVYSLPILSLSSPGSSVCAGTVANYQISGASSYTWSGGSNNTTFTVLPVNTATYVVSGTSNDGCISTLPFSVGVFTLPIISVAPISQTVCSGTTASYSASGALTYTWSNSGQGSIGTFTPLTNSAYTVNGKSTDGCVSSATVMATVIPSPTILVTGAQASVCPGSTLNLTASGASTYLWNGVVNSPSFSVTASSNTIYTVAGTLQNGCSTTQSISVNVFIPTSPAISPSQHTMCVGELVEFTGPSTYTWAPSNTVSSSFTASPLTNSTYTVHGFDSNQCLGKTIVQVFVDECTGLSSTGLLKNIKLYPNPASTQVYIEMPSGKKDLVLRNTLSQIIEIKSTSEPLTFFNLSNLSKGVYFVEVMQGGTVQQFKLVVQ